MRLCHLAFISLCFSILLSACQQKDQSNISSEKPGAADQESEEEEEIKSDLPKTVDWTPSGGLSLACQISWHSTGQVSCIEYRNLTAGQQRFIAVNSCSLKYTPKSDWGQRCKQDNVVGQCPVKKTKHHPDYTVYFKQGYSSAQAQQLCAQSKRISYEPPKRLQLSQSKKRPPPVEDTINWQQHGSETLGCMMASLAICEEFYDLTSTQKAYIAKDLCHLTGAPNSWPAKCDQSKAKDECSVGGKVGPKARLFLLPGFQGNRDQVCST